MSSTDLSIHSLETLAHIISGGVQELRNSRAEGATRCLEQLDFLKAMFLDGIRISDALRNTVVPINRLPPEILTDIFSMLRDELPVVAYFPARWPFKVYRTESLEPLLAVCRCWRDLVLGTPSLWNRFQAVHDRGSTKHFNRSFGSPVAIDIVSCYTRKMDAWCRQLEGQIRELHIHVKWNRGEEAPGSIFDFLLAFSAPELVHCKINFLNVPFPLSLWDSPSVPLFAGHGNKLRSLYLAGTPLLPANTFPLLTRFALCHSPYVYFEDNKPNWNLDDLVKFLSGSPRLEELYLCCITIQGRAPHPDNAHRPSSVKLHQLRYFAIDAYGEPAIIPAIRMVDSAIISPPSCHRFYTPIHPVEFIPMLLGDRAYRRLRIDFSGRKLLQFADDQGSVSMCAPVRSESDWSQLHTLFQTSPFLEAIEELWLALGPTEYEMTRSLPPLFSWFPKVRGLSITLNPFFASHQCVALEYVLSPLHADTLMCPLLDTLCINLPGSVTSVDQLEYMLSARSRRHPVRRLVVGYDPRLDLPVLADVFAFERLVDELVIGEVMVPASLASDWLLDVHNAFDDERSAIKEGWPRWSENPM